MTMHSGQAIMCFTQRCVASHHVRSARLAGCSVIEQGVLGRINLPYAIVQSLKVATKNNHASALHADLCKRLNQRVKQAAARL